MAAPAFLLDSSACIQVLRGHTALDKLPDLNRSALSVIVVSELWVGVEKDAANAFRRAELTFFLNLLPHLNYDDAAARHYGQIRADLEKKGTLIGPLDMLIAAHARSLGATLITGNTREFRRVDGLKVLSWR